MRIYLATRLENVDNYRLARDKLIAAGHTLTYDWSNHGSVQHLGEARIAEVAEAEARGILSAEAVVVLLPGGKGTHVELGIAIGAGKPAFVVADPTLGFLNEIGGRTCAFYHHSRVARCGTVEDAIAGLQRIGQCRLSDDFNPFPFAEDLEAFDAAWEVIHESAPAGGCLHIILDDLNVEDSHVAFCRKFHMSADDEYCKRDPGIRLHVERVLGMLSSISRDDRARLLGAPPYRGA